MKTLSMALLTRWITFAHILAQAQTPAGKISGVIVGTDQKPVDGASITLLNAQDSTTVKTLLGNVNGTFAFNNLPGGNYRLKVTMLGYQNYKSGLISIGDKPLVTLPAIVLQQTSKALKEVAVTAQKDFVEQKIDRTVVNVNALISNTGANALEVLEKTPGVLVDENGTISFKGKSGVMILIDDKPTYLSGDNLASYLKAMPASLLDQIELMSNPPAKYEAAGNAGVINIKTKKSKTQGFNGSLAANIGKAAYWRTNESLTLNYHVDKVNLFANLGYNLFNNYRQLEVTRQYFSPGGALTSAYNESAFFHPKNYNKIAKIGMDYYASPQTTIGFVLTGYHLKGATPNAVSSVLKSSSGAIDSTILAQNKSINNLKNGGLNLNYNHKFDKPGTVLSFNLDYLKYDNVVDQTFVNNTYLANGTLANLQIITDNLPTSINIYAAKTDYSQALPNKGKLEAGLKTSFVNTDNAANYFNVVNNISTINYNNTNRFLYNENINAAYLSFNQEYKRFSIQAGLRLENTNITGHQLGNALRGDSSFIQHYTNVFPTAYLLYKLDTAGKHTLNLSYGRRIGRPYYQDLNPFITIIDKYSQFEGNPFLRPQFSSNYQLTYSYRSIWSIALEYNYVSDYQTESDIQRDGIFMATSVNLGQSVFYGINSNLTLTPFKWWNFHLYFQLSTNHDKGDIYQSYLNIKQTSYNINNINQFTFGRGWSGELTYYYLSPTQSAQFTHISREQVNAAIQKKILNNKAAIKLSARDIFRGNFSAGDITNIPNTKATYYNDFANRVLILGFSYSFGTSLKSDKKHDSNVDEQGRVR
ncbi:MAG: outer membrane beta-barrel protein [Mucilaginibacter sp.]|uniref:outer membrane beta-barrel protein n=1 Tax=Mucilaginibacter sp. TaxID=1882438 RepID=UPI003263CC32